jgi:hypothetical protein
VPLTYFLAITLLGAAWVVAGLVDHALQQRALSPSSVDGAP